MKLTFPKILQPTHANLKTAKSPLARAHRGAHQRSLDPRPLPLMRLPMCKKKISRDLGLNQCTVATIHKRILTKRPKKTAISGLWRAHGPGYMSL